MTVKLCMCWYWQLSDLLEDLNSSYLTPCRVVLGVSRGRKPVKTFPTSHGTRSCNIVFLGALHFSKPWARRILSTSSHTVSLRYISNNILPETPRSPKQHVGLDSKYNTENGSCNISKRTHSWAEFFVCTHRSLKKFTEENAFIFRFSMFLIYFNTI